MMRAATALGFLTAVSVVAPQSASAQVIGGCKFDPRSLTFAGTTHETAQCLLKKVKEKGTGAEVQEVPTWLQDRIGRPFPYSAAQLASYLSRQRIDAAELTKALSKGDVPAVRYFVIHDTSYPEEETSSKEFPPNINEASWSGNNLKGWGKLDQKVNLLISRDGRSRRMTQWGAARQLSGIKVEDRAPAARRRFVHVENIQPRNKPPRSFGWIAPNPGFGPKQEQRLAVAYFVASLHAGRWLIPAYHFNIDQGLPEGHDDPQHTDLVSWVNRLAAIEAALREQAR